MPFYKHLIRKDVIKTTNNGYLVNLSGIWTPTKKAKDRFRFYFNKSLLSFWNPIIGFDIAKFDEFIKTPDGISLSNYLINNYNKSARDLILALISSPE